MPLLVRVGSLEKTRSGKIVAALTRALALDGQETVS
jgi:acyl-coenzyme A synthetase/AMP-(fatty) acid ligase